jgi:transposase
MLQAKGRHCAVRKLENREQRIVTQKHVMSRQLVALTRRCKAGIRFEDVPGIRAFAPQRKDTRSDVGQNRDDWSFYQLETLARCKALAASVAVDAVRSHDTSQTCHRCGVLNKRHQHACVCTRCGYKAHTDANAAMNVRDGYGLCCPLVLHIPAGA